jgi:hypothetical protein
LPEAGNETLEELEQAIAVGTPGLLAFSAADYTRSNTFDAGKCRSHAAGEKGAHHVDDLLSLYALTLATVGAYTRAASFTNEREWGDQMNMMQILRAVVIAATMWLHAIAASALDFDTGNAAIEVVIPTVAPIIFTDISPSGGDATLVLRVTTVITNSWFDATAPYHPTAVGVYSRLGRRPAAEAATNRNVNIALLYGSYRVLNSLLPQRAQEWRGMLTGVGLDPDDDSLDTTTPVGLGNVAGQAVVAAREHDGMNQLGDEGGRIYNLRPYADYTGYKPVNTGAELNDPSRWQPDVDRVAAGLYKEQVFVTPQYALVTPYSYKNAKKYRVPPPVDSNHHRFTAYKSQADEVLAYSAALTDDMKMKAELFDNKILSLGFSAVFAAQSRGLSLLEFIQLDFLTNMAAFDAGIVTWQEKKRYDAVRPFSAIRYIYRDDRVTAWGGPGKGTVSNLPANQWESYLNVADHPEYPSGSACFCAAHTQSARRYLGDDVLNWTVPAPAGSSRVEPGVTPASDIALQFPTWTAFNHDCGQSRVWGGVHFQPAVTVGRGLCNVFGDLAYGYLSKLLAGTAEPR